MLFTLAERHLPRRTAMRLPPLVIGLVVGLVVLLVAVAAVLAQGGKPAPTETAEHDFGARIVVIVTLPRGEKAEVGGGSYEKAKIHRLGGRSFLVGKVLDVDGTRKEIVGKTIWTPVEDITTLTEFENLKELKDARMDRNT